MSTTQSNETTEEKNEPNPQFIQKRSNDDKVNYVNCPLVDLCKCGNAYFIHFSRITATTTTERDKKVHNFFFVWLLWNVANCEVYQTTGKILKFIPKDEECDGKWTNGRKTEILFRNFLLVGKMANKSYYKGGHLDLAL